jgi:protein phosphatase
MSEDREFDTAEFPSLPPDLPPIPLRRIRPATVDFGAESHQGRVRANNEDHFLVGRIRRSLSILLTNVPEGCVPGEHEEDGYAMAVADGMGGAASGEHASLLAIVTGLRLVLNTNRWNMAMDSAEARELVAKMQQYFSQVDRALIDQARADPRLAGMGTTLIVSYSVGDSLFVVHAGDSRAYLLRGGHLERLTRDHTLSQLLADSGQISHRDAETHSKRHVLTNYLGGPTHGVKAEIQSFRLEDQDRLLLCSDGLTDMVDDPTIAAILRDHPEPADACRALIAKALDRGGSDNVTVTLARYRFPSATA